MVQQKTNRKQIIDELWRRGNLKWKLDENQNLLYDLFYESSYKSMVWLLARRTGKTYCLVTLAIEKCLKNPNTIVKFLSPTKTQVNNNLRPLIRDILEDCPQELKPEFKIKEYIYFFPNGSEIQLAGTDKGHAEKLRGGDAHLVIIDEAGTCSDLDNIIKSILLPTTLVTKGKIIFASTPPENSDHEFLKFIERAQINGSLIKKTIHDNPRLTKDMIDEIVEETGGMETEAFRREYLCELIKSEKSSVIPEFTTDLKKEIIREWPEPPFFDSYVSMDIGFNDLTVVLFGYYDFRAGKVIIQDEIVRSGSELHLPELGRDILKTEENYWTNKVTNEIKKPYIRVSDNDLIVLNDLMRHSNYQLTFITADKRDKEGSINNVRVLLKNRRVIIHPRCKTLIRHLDNVRFKNGNSSDFARSEDDGHYDAVDALKYMLRHVQFNKNPYPTHYGLNTNDLYVHNSAGFNSINQMDVYKKIFGIKKRSN